MAETRTDILLDKAIQMMHANLPKEFIEFIDDDLHNRIVCAFEDYIEVKKLFEDELNERLDE